jgi:endonuclease/exonuclease/phosphatase family metal-dependent hydrolase
MKRCSKAVVILSALLILLSEGSAQTLRVATLNIWTGLNYKGLFALGEYESTEQRDRRFRVLVDHLRRLDADVIALQEVNPVYEKAELLASELGYDALYLRGNAGIKFGALGLPWNIDEGLVVLARKGLDLRLLDWTDFSHGFGVTGNTFAFHFNDRNVGLAVHVRKGGVDVVLMNTHLTSALPDVPELRSKLSQIDASKPAKVLEEDLRRLTEGQQKRTDEVTDLLKFLDASAPGLPVILVGDLNCTPASGELRLLSERGGFQDVGAALPDDRSATWDPVHNPNIDFSTKLWRTQETEEDSYDLLDSWYDTVPRRIDYILLSKQFAGSAVRSVSRQFDEPVLGTFVSDHFGVMAEIDISQMPPTPHQDEQPANPASLDVLPIASYDTDVGFGLGLKAFTLNAFGASESFDGLVFASTGGERLAKLVFSIPDFELRQGRVYPLSFDLAIEYDKYLKNPFFGLGNTSTYDARETYTKEPLEVSALFGRGFSPSLVAEAGVKFKTVRNYNYADTSLFAQTPPALNQGTSSGLSAVLSARYDSRTSYINPLAGAVVQFDLEVGKKKFLSDYDIIKTSLSIQGYRAIFTPRTVLAIRISGQAAAGDSLPVHTLPWLGGSKTLRGYPMDRFLDKVRLLSTVELRIPLVWRVGAVVGIDAGKVWSSPSEVDLRNWAWNGVFGLRFYFDSFVARADLGLSREYTGFYLDFGHSF